MTRPDSAACSTLSCEGLYVRRDGRLVLHDVSLRIAAGECVSIIGPNGAGKTTLMLTLLGILSPEAGTVRLDGQDLRALSARWRARLMSYVPQTVERLPDFTVREVVAFGRFPHLRPLFPLSAQDRDAVEDALRICDLTDLASRPVSRLSGGERQKTLIAAAIAQDAQIMCLDEPGTALDPAYQVELVRLLRAWHQRGRTLILISHDLYLPGVLGGRTVALRDGRIVADASSAELLRPEALCEIYDAGFEVATTPAGHHLLVPDWWQAARSNAGP